MNDRIVMMIGFIVLCMLICGGISFAMYLSVKNNVLEPYSNGSLKEKHDSC